MASSAAQGPSATRGPSASLPTIVTMGCPSSIGPELSVRALCARGAGDVLVIGDQKAMLAAGRVLGVSMDHLERRMALRRPDADGLPRAGVLQAGKALPALDRKPGRPTAAGGRAQLGYVEEGYRLAKSSGRPLVTNAVSKEVIARSGLARARSFLGHTEWLEALDGAPFTVMCFASPRLVTALVTTHVPLAKVGPLLSPALVARSIEALATLLHGLGHAAPKIAIASFNPHAGEGGLLGREETRAIIPGITSARKRLASSAVLTGPMGAETAYRLAAAGGFDGVVGIYHDQATIPMKLLDFGRAVNVTEGLSIVRTSVDHGTAYDIAGLGIARSDGLMAALSLARRLGWGRMCSSPR